MVETKYAGLLRSSRKDKTLAYTDNICDPNLNQMQDALNQLLKQGLQDISTLQSQTKQIKDTVDGIAISGGASVASAVSFEDTETQLDAINVQVAIEKLDKKDTDQDEVIKTKADEASFEELQSNVNLYDCSNGGTIIHNTLQEAINSVPEKYQKAGACITYKKNTSGMSFTAKLKCNYWSPNTSDWVELEGLLPSMYIAKDTSFITWINGYFITLNGKIEVNREYCYSSPIQINRGDVISIHDSFEGLVSLISKCDKDGNDISPLVKTDNINPYGIDYIFNEDCYVVLCITINNRNSIAISKNTITNTILGDNSANIFKGNNLSFIGDSITAYSYYSKCSNASYPDNTVLSERDMWWGILANMLGMSIDTVNAIGGASVTRQDGRVCLLDRCEDLGKPDVIFVAAGTNDVLATLGVPDFSKEQKDLSDTIFAEAYDKLYRKMEAKYPNSEIVFIVPAHLSMKDAKYSNNWVYNENVTQGDHGLLREVIYKIAQHYGVRLVDLSLINDSISKKDYLHPNKYGMQMMANNIFSSVVTFSENSNRFSDKLTYDECLNRFFKEIYCNSNEELSICVISRQYLLSKDKYWQIQLKLGVQKIDVLFAKNDYDESSIIEYSSADSLVQIVMVVDWSVLPAGGYYAFRLGTMKVSDKCKDINRMPAIKSYLESKSLRDNNIYPNAIKDETWNKIIKEIYYTGNYGDKLVLVSVTDGVVEANVKGYIINSNIQDGIAEFYVNDSTKLIAYIDEDYVESIGGNYSKILNISYKNDVYNINSAPTIKAFLSNIIPTSNLREYYANGKKTAFFDKDGRFNFLFGENIKPIEDGARIALAESQETTQRYVAVWAPFVGYNENGSPKYNMAVAVSEDGKFFSEITRFDIATLNDSKWRWLRDPSIIRYKGVFYVAIGANEGNESYFGILKSTDLKNWSLVKNVKCKYDNKYLKPTAPEIFMVDDKPYVVFQGSFAHALTRPKCYIVELSGDVLTSLTDEVSLDAHYIDLGESTAIDFSIIKADNGKYILGMARDWIQTFYESNELFGNYTYLGEANFGILTEGTNIVRIAENVYRIYITTNNDNTYNGFLETMDFRHFYGPTKIINERGSTEYRHGTVLALKNKKLNTERILEEIL